MKPHKIVVAGDVCVDVIMVPIQGRARLADTATCENWKLVGEMRTMHRRGGALLLADMITAAVGTAVPVVGPELLAPDALSKGRTYLTEEQLPRLTSLEIVHSVIRCGRFPDRAGDKKPAKRLRVDELHGYSGPRDSGGYLSLAEPSTESDSMLVIDDTGNRFRTGDQETYWTRLLDAAPVAIVYKLHRPLPLDACDRPRPENPLWARVTKDFIDRTVVVASVDDLRQCGAAITRQLSWERSARELAAYLLEHTSQGLLGDSRWLVVRFAQDGALCWHRRGAPGSREHRCWLVYDPESIEHQFVSRFSGSMVGHGCAFTAALTAALATGPGEGLWADADELPTCLADAVRHGLGATRKLHEDGFGEDEEQPRFPMPVAGKTPTAFHSVTVPIPAGRHAADPVGDWTILRALLPGGRALDDAAEGLVRWKKPPSGLDLIPVGVFGKLRTYDRTEIEAFRATANLIREYLAVPQPKRPLCLGVFGPPGAGKSFSVEQVAQSVAGTDVKLERLVFNLSQFQAPAELARALHLVRDVALERKVPLVFFDEFDSSVGETRLYWLKHMLAPMQDGQFLDQGAAHPIGKAIFIFAGGTAWSYEDFLHGALKRDKAAGPHEESADHTSAEAFRNAKGPDFLSRLRGFLDMKGLDHAEGQYRGPVLLRRAGILRYQLTEKAPHLLDRGGETRIDDGVLRAFLQVQRYEHGVRSLEALIEMSVLSDGDRFAPSCLPPTEQMALHVVPTQTDQPGRGFLDLVNAESPWGQQRDAIARAIHEHYLDERRRNNQLRPDKASHQEWKELNDFYRDSNRAQADDIPRKLRVMGLDYRPRGEQGELGVVTMAELESDAMTELVEQAARAEHDRWYVERLKDRWAYGKTEDTVKRTHPNLQPWDQMTSDADGSDPREKDRAAIRALPRYLEAGGFVVVSRKR